MEDNLEWKMTQGVRRPFMKNTSDQTNLMNPDIHYAIKQTKAGKPRSLKNQFLFFPKINISRKLYAKWFEKCLNIFLNKMITVHLKDIYRVCYPK